MIRELCVSLAALVVLTSARQAHADDEAETRQMTREEIEAWLDARAVPGTRDVGEVQAPPEAPPPAPRHHGVVIESGVGIFGHLGPLKNVSPNAPFFHLQLGYEPFKFLMVFGESDVSFSDTSYANPPPEPRAYALYGFGFGARLTILPLDRLGLYAQVSIGTARVSDDVLNVYGYKDADDFNPYFGGMLGVEWYQANPHYALVLNGGLRNYPDGFARQRSSGTTAAVIVGIALRYAF
jgi:hypothetical protein